jgi:hypothetical protein
VTVAQRALGEVHPREVGQGEVVEVERLRQLAEQIKRLLSIVVALVGIVADEIEIPDDPVRARMLQPSRISSYVVSRS